MYRKFVSYSCTVLAFAFGLATASSNADVIVYDNSVLGATGVEDALESDDDAGVRCADDVNLTVNTTITGVEWTGIYFNDNTPPASDDFTIAILADDTGEPMTGAPIASFAVGNLVNRADSGEIIFGFNVYEFSADINFTMTAGTTYWLSVYGDTVGEDDAFAWAGINNSGNAFQSFDENASWEFFGDNFRMDFRLTASAIPEPGSFTIHLLFLTFVLRARRRR